MSLVKTIKMHIQYSFAKYLDIQQSNLAKLNYNNRFELFENAIFSFISFWRLSVFCITLHHKKTIKKNKINQNIMQPETNTNTNLENKSEQQEETRKYQTLQTEVKDNYCIVKMDNGRANVLNLQMLKDLRQVFSALSADEAIEGVVLVGKEKFFSAGFDLIEISTYNREQLKVFLQQFNNLVFELTSFPKPLVAAVTGHSPAGGCVLAICCDYRVMAEGFFQIGLNEVPVNIIVPDGIFHLYAFWIGRNLAYEYLLEGKLLTVEEAVNVKLIDDVAEPQKVLKKAEAKLQLYLQFDSLTWRTTKSNLRYHLIQKVKMDFDKEFTLLLDNWFTPKIQAQLNAMVEKLTAGKEEKAS